MSLPCLILQLRSPPVAVELDCPPFSLCCSFCLMFILFGCFASYHFLYSNLKEIHRDIHETTKNLFFTYYKINSLFLKHSLVNLYTILKRAFYLIYSVFIYLLELRLHVWFYIRDVLNNYYQTVDISTHLEVHRCVNHFIKIIKQCNKLSF